MIVSHFVRNANIKFHGAKARNCIIHVSISYFIAPAG